MDDKPSRPRIFQPDSTTDAEAKAFVEELRAQGLAVKVTPYRTELPVDEAADAIDMARDDFRSYVAAGEIPFRSTQYVDWVLLADAIELKKRLKAQSGAALDELLSEPLWDDDGTDGSRSDG
ncbi:MULTISPECIES: hypothetical protein [Kribbella]|uniref:hypothetical protein n=1 Tax=Kribbella TaxID=182639 RepID=UPI0013054371|nr:MULTISPECIES: hypothetical protein [Kribbella]